MSQWLEKKEDWLGKGPGRKIEQSKPRPLEGVYSVASVAELMDVGKHYIYKLLNADVIPEDGWFRLHGNGHIRIKAWLVEKLLNGEI